MSVGIPGGGLQSDAFVGQLTSQGISAETAAQTAQRIDTDGDGVVTQAEARADYDQMVSQHGGTDGLNVVQVSFDGGSPHVAPPAPGENRTTADAGPADEAIRRAFVDLQRVEDPSAEEVAERLRHHLAQAGFEDAESMAAGIVQAHAEQLGDAPFSRNSIQQVLAALTQATATATA